MFVSAGQTYSVKISDGAPWDYDDLNLPFVMTTSIEQSVGTASVRPS